MSSPFVSVAELVKELASDHPPVVLDASLVLHPPEFDGDYRRESGRPGWLDAHIPGSRYVDVSEQFSDPAAALHYTHPTPQALADELARLGIAEHSDVVIYDSTGTIWAARLWYLLDWIGVAARVLNGGLRAWQTAGEPTESGESDVHAPVETWHAAATRDAWITLDELVARAAEDERPLVCGLPAGSFTGDVPTRYSRRGRIPNSVNVSSRELFARDGSLVENETILARYEAEGVTPHVPGVLLYCGGGISASANALTLAQVGIRNVRIYDGSLEEWSADPSLPLLTGA